MNMDMKHLSKVMFPHVTANLNFFFNNMNRPSSFFYRFVFVDQNNALLQIDIKFGAHTLNSI
jgi:hypothetical protein